jgi:hypothetical protein
LAVTRRICSRSAAVPEKSEAVCPSAPIPSGTRILARLARCLDHIVRAPCKCSAPSPPIMVDTVDLTL